MIMRQEIGAAKNQSGIAAKSFEKSGVCSSSSSNFARPLSQLSDSSDEFKLQFDVGNHS